LPLKAADLPLLNDHKIGASAVLPTVCAQAWMIEAAAIALGIDSQSLTTRFMPQLNDYKLFKGVVFDGTEPTSLQLLLDVTEQGVVKVKVSSFKADGKVQFHYAGDVSFSARENSTVVLPQEAELQRLRQASQQAYYQDGSLFHLDSLQGLKADLKTGDESLWFACQLPASHRQKASGFNLQQAHNQVFVNDLVYQAMLVWVRQNMGQGSLPSTTKAWQYIAVPSSDNFLIQVERPSVNGQSVSANINVVSESGELLAKLEACEVTASESLNDKFKRSDEGAAKV